MLSGIIGGGSGAGDLGFGSLRSATGMAMGAAGFAVGVATSAPAQTVAGKASSVAGALAKSFREINSEGRSAPPDSFGGGSQTKGGQSASTPLSNAMGLNNKFAAPADPKKETESSR